ncbi:MAG: hypothetical protein IPJ65_25060 [Archangiaceae bacterium]|nr:hypothetical protein [Archangiaceae bacterium]
MRRLISLALPALLAACGGQLTPSRSVTAQQALTQTAEFLEFETAGTRAELFRDVARTSMSQSGKSGTVMFPVARSGLLVAAPGIGPGTDLLTSADAGASLQLVLDSPGDAWAVDRRESFQGLSEREAAELVARSLLNLWGISSSGPIVVERAAGAPWAAAYVDGILRVNPSFVYMAAAPAAP